MSVLPVGVEEAAPAERRPAFRPVLALTFVLAACSILYELIAAQTLSLLAADTVVWYSLVVGVFLASMGYGSFRSRRVGRECPWRALVRVEIALAVIGACAVPLLRLAHTAFSHFWTEGSLKTGLAVFLGVSFTVVAATGVLTGIELPLLIRVGREIRDEARTASVVLGVDYLGSLAGAVLFPLVVLPNMGVLSAGFAVAAVNLLAALWVLDSRVWPGGRRRETVLAWTAMAGLVAGIASLDRLEQYFLRRFYYRVQLGTDLAGRFEPRPDLPRVQHERSPYQEIDVLTCVQLDFTAAVMPAYSTKTAEDPKFPVDRVLFLNGDFQTNTRYEEVYHEWFAHVPVAATARVPEDVLVLGGGDGFLIRELVKHEGIRRIRHVDLDPVLVSMAKNDPVLRAVNRDALRDPRVETTFEDGFQFVRESEESFDAVYIDFPAAVNYDLAKLYSREFLEFVRQRVARDGYAVFDATGTSLLTTPNAEGRRFPTPENDWPVYLATARAAGWGMVEPYLSTFETDNEAAREILRKFTLDERAEASLAAIEDEAERERARTDLREQLVDAYLHSFAVQLEQGFILLLPEERALADQFPDLDVELHSLNAERYELAFATEFPRPREIDEAKVNSILRPTLPTSPWWQPRIGY